VFTKGMETMTNPDGMVERYLKTGKRSGGQNSKNINE